jgi:hypothetical protein
VHSDRTGGDEPLSDTSQGQGWWLASDGKWYAPELWTGSPQSGPTSDGMPGTSQASDSGEPGQAAQPVQSDAAQTHPGGLPAYPGDAPIPDSAAGYQSSGFPGPGGAGQPHNAPAGYGGATLVPKNNGLAVASLICSCFGVVLFTLPCILGVIFGFVARSQIRRSQGAQKGDGLALAGIIVGFAGIALVILIVVVRVANNHNSGVMGL